MKLIPASLEFTAYLEILAMYREDGRVSCIPGVSRPSRETWQVCYELGLLAKIKAELSGQAA